jgi:hypothetical protein
MTRHPDLLTRADIAARIGCSERWLIRNGPPRLKAYGRRVMYHRGNVDDWMHERKLIALVPSLDMTELERFEPHPSDTYAYAIGMGDNGPVKIGHTNKPSRRLENLQHANPATLHLLAVMKGGGFLEPLLHLALKPLRLRGEWFGPRHAVELFIDHQALRRLRVNQWP